MHPPIEFREAPVTLERAFSAFKDLSNPSKPNIMASLKFTIECSVPQHVCHDVKHVPQWFQ